MKLENEELWTFDSKNFLKESQQDNDEYKKKENVLLNV